MQASALPIVYAHLNCCRRRGILHSEGSLPVGTRIVPSGFKRTKPHRKGLSVPQFLHLQNGNRLQNKGGQEGSAKPAEAPSDNWPRYLQLACRSPYQGASIHTLYDRLCHNDPISHQRNFQSIFIGSAHLQEGPFLTPLGNPFIPGLPGRAHPPSLICEVSKLLSFPGRVSPIYRPPGGIRMGAPPGLVLAPASGSSSPPPPPSCVAWDQPPL